MITGVNDSSKEDKFVSGSYKLVEGEHLTNDDKDKDPPAQGLGSQTRLESRGQGQN